MPEGEITVAATQEQSTEIYGKRYWFSREKRQNIALDKHYRELFDETSVQLAYAPKLWRQMVDGSTAYTEDHFWGVFTSLQSQSVVSVDDLRSIFERNPKLHKRFVEEILSPPVTPPAQDLSADSMRRTQSDPNSPRASIGESQGLSRSISSDNVQRLRIQKQGAIAAALGKKTMLRTTAGGNVQFCVNLFYFPGTATFLSELSVPKLAEMVGKDVRISRLVLADRALCIKLVQETDVASLIGFLETQRQSNEPQRTSLCFATLVCGAFADSSCLTKVATMLGDGPTTDGSALFRLADLALYLNVRGFGDFTSFVKALGKQPRLGKVFTDNINQLVLHVEKECQKKGISKKATHKILDRLLRTKVTTVTQEKPVKLSQVLRDNFFAAISKTGSKEGVESLLEQFKDAYLRGKLDLNVASVKMLFDKIGSANRPQFDLVAALDPHIYSVMAIVARASGPDYPYLIARDGIGTRITAIREYMKGKSGTVGTTLNFHEAMIIACDSKFWTQVMPKRGLFERGSDYAERLSKFSKISPIFRAKISLMDKGGDASFANIAEEVRNVENLSRSAEELLKPLVGFVESVPSSPLIGSTVQQVPSPPLRVLGTTLQVLEELPLTLEEEAVRCEREAAENKESKESRDHVKVQGTLSSLEMLDKSRWDAAVSELLNGQQRVSQKVLDDYCTERASAVVGKMLAGKEIHSSAYREAIRTLVCMNNDYVTKALFRLTQKLTGDLESGFLGLHDSDHFGQLAIESRENVLFWQLALQDKKTFGKGGEGRGVGGGSSFASWWRFFDEFEKSPGERVFCTMLKDCCNRDLLEFLKGQVQEIDEEDCVRVDLRNALEAILKTTPTPSVI